MRKAYMVIVNALLFYFVVAIVNGVKIRGGLLIDVIVASLIFGILMASITWILKFFKITVNLPSKLLMSIVLSFVFFFLIYNGILGIGSIGASVVDFGLGGASALKFDAVGTLIFVSIVSGVGSAGLDWLSNA